MVRLLIWSSLCFSLAASLSFADELSDIKANMEKLTTTTVAGSYYKDAQVPADLDAFRADMLKIGNLGRQDKDYRTKHGEKVATDLSGQSVVINGKEEKIFKNQATPPYFKDLVLNNALNQAAQFQAEYQASLDQMSHDGPADFNGKSMKHFFERAGHFGYSDVLEGEGTATVNKTSETPEVWMQSDTHFRPWFNVGSDVREMGFGIAKSPKGIWFTVVVSGTGQK